MASRCAVCGEFFGERLGACDCFVGGVFLHPRWLEAAFWARVRKEAAS
jgi:hypothetical protein